MIFFANFFFDRLKKKKKKVIFTFKTSQRAKDLSQVVQQRNFSVEEFSAHLSCGCQSGRADWKSAGCTG